ncbi:MAG: terminase large subunit [Candidatus Binatus sp.]|nr:terminase large subunit [Candidatus Binatus sp.]
MSDALSILLPYQRRWIGDQAQVKVCEKSRRIGITWAEACDRALSAASAGRKGMDAWYIGYNKDMALEFVETAAQWARRFNQAAEAIEEVAIDDERTDIRGYRIRFASGHKIVALSSRPSNLRGKAGCAVIDEAAFHEDLPGLLKAALAFTMWGGLVRIISTHNGADSAFNELVTDIRAGRKPYSLHRTSFDEALSDGLYRKICEQRGLNWSLEGESAWRESIVSLYSLNADEELFCIPRASSSTYLSSVMIEARMRPDIPVLRWDRPSEFAARPEEVRRAETQDWCEENLAAVLGALDPKLKTCFGEDFARSGDLTVIWPLQIASNLIRRTPFIVELRNIPFRNQEQILFYIADRLPAMIAGAMDARGNGQYLAEIASQRYGSRIVQVMLSEAWYRENMPRYKAAFEDGTIEIPLDAEVLSDHRAIALERGVAKISERRIAGDGKGRHGDSAMAGALAYFASRAATSEISYTPVAGRRSGLFGESNSPFSDSNSELRFKHGRGF